MPPKDKSPSGWDTFFRAVVQPRLEVIVTILLDTGVIVTALVCRGLALRAYKFGTEGGNLPWHIRTLEYVLDYGVVASATAFVMFDLAKRVKNAWEDFTDKKDKR